MRAAIGRGMCVVVGIACATSVHAQSELDDLFGTASAAEAPAPVQPAAPASDVGEAEPQQRRRLSRVVEEIVVTAQKREENLSDVPISVQAFSADALDARGVQSTMDLMKVTPGLDFGVQAGDFASVFLRGIGSEAWLTSDPSVASYVDGVYYSFTPSLIQDLGGVERVEVLKGPQGTLFGRNAIAGAINVITKEPDFDDRSITIDQYFGSYSSRKDLSVTKTTLFANMPITDTFAMNVSAFYEYDAQQWTEDATIAGKPIPAKTTFSGRLKARWLPTEDLELRATLLGSKREGTSTLAANINPTPLGQLLGIDGVKERARSPQTDLPMYGHLTSMVGALTGIYSAPWFDTKLILSKQVHSNPYNYDYDGSEVPFASFIVHRHYAKINEAEIQFLSNESSWGADWLTWAAGGFYFANDQGFDPVELTVGGLDPLNLSGINLLGLLDNPLLANTVGLVDAITDRLQQPIPVLGNLLNGFPSYGLSNTGMVETESWSVFLQATAEITDWFSLTLGGRYQNEFRGVLDSRTALRVGNPGELGFREELFVWQRARDARGGLILGVPFGNMRSNNDVTKAFTPKVSLDFRPFEDDTLIWLSGQRAVKAHSFNAFAFYLPLAYVPEETIDAFELGAKGTLFDGSVRYTAAFFHYEIQNLQTQFISLLNGGALSLDVAGNSRSIGFDFDIAIDVLPSYFDGLALTLNGAFIDAKYTEYQDGDGQEPTTGLFLDNFWDYTGNRVTRTPEFSGSMSLSNTWLVPGGTLEASGNLYYNSGFFYVPSEDPRYEQPAYTTLNAQLSYYWERNRLRATLVAENLTDEFYTTGTLVLDPGMLATLAPPRTIGLKLQWTF